MRVRARPRPRRPAASLWEGWLCPLQPQRAGKTLCQPKTETSGRAGSPGATAEAVTWEKWRRPCRLRCLPDGPGGGVQAVLPSRLWARKQVPGAGGRGLPSALGGAGAEGPCLGWAKPAASPPVSQMKKLRLGGCVICCGHTAKCRFGLQDRESSHCWPPVSSEKQQTAKQLAEDRRWSEAI